MQNGLSRKGISLYDIFLLTGLYLLRLVACHEVTGIERSYWLLVFTGFTFLSLALVKRAAELLKPITVRHRLSLVAGMLLMIAH